MPGRVRVVAVVHSLVPGEEGSPNHNEWTARLNQANRAYNAGDVDRIIVTGGRGIVGGREYDNPRQMREYLVRRGIPGEAIISREIKDEELETPANPMDTKDEIDEVRAMLEERGWLRVIVRPITNWLHMLRVLVMYRALTGKTPRLTLWSLPTRIMMGWKWALLTEMAMCWPYTLLDRGWTGPRAEKVRVERRRAGMPGASSRPSESS